MFVIPNFIISWVLFKFHRIEVVKIKARESVNVSEGVNDHLKIKLRVKDDEFIVNIIGQGEFLVVKNVFTFIRMSCWSLLYLMLRKHRIE